MPRAVSESTPRYDNLSASDLRLGRSERLGVQPPLAKLIGSSVNRPAPVRILPPMLPHMAR
jgi:hypothetical protein